MAQSPMSIYLHSPFCTVKCSYCAFNIFTNLEHHIPNFIRAMQQEINWLAARTDDPVHTIYIGGGTPSLLTPEQISQLLNSIQHGFHVQPQTEITMEANPDNMHDIERLKAFHQTGVNRLSMGIQSMQPAELAFFGRLHNVEDVYIAYKNARAAGFNNISVDLIYGAPEQTIAGWRDTLKQVISLNPEHISLYALGIEPKTALNYWVEMGKVLALDDDIVADMYDEATYILERAGYQQYEISNWSRDMHESRHNKQYWYNLPYLGLGPGAHGYANGYRYSIHRSVRTYIERNQNAEKHDDSFPLSPATEESTIVSREDEISETIMMGLRLTHEGIDLDTFYSRFGVDLLALKGDTIKAFIDSNLLQLHNQHLRLTKRGRLVSNRILRDLI